MSLPCVRQVAEVRSVWRWRLFHLGCHGTFVSARPGDGPFSIRFLVFISLSLSLSAPFLFPEAR